MLIHGEHPRLAVKHPVCVSSPNVEIALWIHQATWLVWALNFGHVETCKSFEFQRISCEIATFSKTQLPFVIKSKCKYFIVRCLDDRVSCSTFCEVDVLALQCLVLLESGLELALSVLLVAALSKLIAAKHNQFFKARVGIESNYRGVFQAAVDAENFLGFALAIQTFNSLRSQNNLFCICSWSKIGFDVDASLKVSAGSPAKNLIVVVNCETMASSRSNHGYFCVLKTTH